MMKHRLALLLIVGIAALLAVSPLAAQSGTAMVYAVTEGGEVISFNTDAPGTILTRASISGLADGDIIAGIDIRPATGQIFGISAANRMIILNGTTGAVTYIGNPLNPAISGSAFGFDFNPTVDRIRLTSDARQDLRLNPINGTVAATDGTLTFAPNDVNAASTPVIVASAYTNNFVNSTTTTLYNLDAGLDILTIQNPPNDGTQVTVGALGFDVGMNASFDIRSIANGTDIGYASIGSGFYTINLASGAATVVGSIGENVRAIAVTSSVAAASAIPMCGDFDGSTNPIVLASAPGADGNVFCRVLAENRQFTSGQAAAQIGVASVVNAGVIQAVDVFQQGGSMNSAFSAPAQVCLLGEGRYIYLDGTQTPRLPQLLETTMVDGYSCAFIPNAGTVVLVNS